MFILWVFLVGLFMGSFLLVVIDRFEKKESFLVGRSKCDSCHKTLAWYDLLPVVSYLSTGGTCRYCHQRLTLTYPLFELLTGILFVVTFLQVSSAYQVVSSMYFISVGFFLYITVCLLLIFFIDLKYGIIPFSIVLPAIIITCFYILFTTNYLILTDVLSALGSFGFFLLIFLLTRGRGMGFGDVVYVFFMGLLLGWPHILVGMYVAFLSGSIISLVLILLKKKKLHGSTIPFGPFLVVGTYIGWLWGLPIFSFIYQWLLYR